MFKRFFGFALGIFLVGAVLAAQAQEGEPLTQPTIDAAVATLIAQTQQSPGVTQTIQAALEQALTATAQAQMPTPTATPEPIDVSGLGLTGTTDLDLLAGPAKTGAYLAPDGQHFAYLMGDSICIYEGTEQQACVNIADIHSLDAESIRWSPDSRYLVFTEDFFVYFVDPDIWVLDTTSTKITDLTDDGPNRINLADDTWKTIDLFPSWTDDGQIVYARYSRVAGTIQPPEIHQIAVDGSGDTILGIIDTNNDPFAVFTMDIWHDQLVYIYLAQGDNLNNGIWISDLNGENPKRILQTTQEAPISAVRMSPDGKYMLVKYEIKGTETTFTPENSWARVFEVESGQEILIDADQFVATAGWSPQGSALVYATYDPATESGNVYLSATPGEAGTPLLEGRFNAATSLQRQFLRWGANGTVLLSKAPQKGIVLMQLG